MCHAVCMFYVMNLLYCLNFAPFDEIKLESTPCQKVWRCNNVIRTSLTDFYTLSVEEDMSVKPQITVYRCICRPKKTLQ